MEIAIKNTGEMDTLKLQKIITYAIVLGYTVNLSDDGIAGKWANKYVKSGQLVIKKKKQTK